MLTNMLERTLLLSTTLMLGLTGTAAADSTVLTRDAIQVQTEATTAARPDLAEIDLGVTTDRPSAAAATAENARRMEQLIAGLKKEGGPGAEVRTVGYSLGPRYGRPGPGQPSKIIGYTASNVVHVRTGEVAAVGRLLDQAFKLGANTVDRVNFTLKDPEPARTEALRLATAQARGRATAMASALGLRLGQVVSVIEGGGAVGLDRPEEGLEGLAYNARRAASTPMEAGTLQVSARVTVLFAIAR
jgi:uncharacterized protein YggE